MARSLKFVLVLLIVTLPISVFAEYEFHQVSETPHHSGDCRVAANPSGEVVVVWAEMDRIFTRTWTDNALTDIVDHGYGSEPAVAWTEDGFWLAWVDPAGLWIKLGDGETWPAGELIYPEVGFPVRAPSLTGKTPPYALNDLLLTFSDEGGRVWFNTYYDGDWWHQFLLLMETVSWDIPRTRCVVTNTGFDTFYSTGEGIYRSLYPGASEQVGETGWLAGAFDIACDPGGGLHLLSNGIQPACPCNLMLYTYRSWPLMEWSETLNLTYDFDHYTWPHDPAIAADTQGVVHACWWQQHYDTMMDPTFRGVFYYTLVDGVWSDQGDLLQGHGHMSRDSDMTLGGLENPVFVFAKDEYSTFNVWLALDPVISNAPEVAPPAARLSAYPNPFNPRTTIRSEHRAGPVQVTLHDVAGRKLRTLHDGWSEGSLTLEWDGRDGAGRELPTGVYLAQVRGADHREQLKLVMIR